MAAPRDLGQELRRKGIAAVPGEQVLVRLVHPAEPRDCGQRQRVAACLPATRLLALPFLRSEVLR